MQKKYLIKILIFFIFISTQANSQFVIQNTPTSGNLQSVSSSSNLCAWAGGPISTLIRTTNGGTNWILANGNLTSDKDIICIWAIDSLMALISVTNASATYGSIYKTTNGGINWLQTYLQQPGFINAISFVNSTTGFANGDPVGGRWTLLKTTNGGDSWDSTGLRLQAVGSEVGFDKCLFYEGNKIWFGTQTGKIYSSTNSGLNWNSTQTLMNGTSRIYFNDATSGNGFAGSEFSGGVKLAKTLDGINWINGNSPSTDDVKGFCGIKGSSKFWTAYDLSIQYTSDNGINWSSVYTSSSTFLTNICSSRTGVFPQTIYVTRRDGKMLVGNTNVVGVNLISSKIPNNFELNQNFPNPFNPQTKIIFKIKSAGNISLKVFDQNGKIVSVLLNEQKPAGTYSILFDGKALASGIYYYKLESEQFSDVKKMIFIK